MSRVPSQVAVALAGASSALLGSLGAVRAQGEDLARFYAGRNVMLVISHEVATGYDLYSRTLARHMGRHLPGNPNIVPQNMQGASGITGGNWLFSVAPKDGSVLGSFAHTVPLDPLIGEGAAKFEAAKFNWLGNMESSVGVCAVWETAGVTVFDDLTRKEVLFGATATTGPPSQMAAAIKSLLGAKVKLIHGYKGAPGVKQAMANGEVAGICGMPMSTLRSSWSDVLDKQLKPIIQLSGPRGALPGVTYVYDRARTDEDRSVFDLIFGILTLGKPHVAPPGVPAERVKALRTAFDATLKDPAFLEEAARLKLDIHPQSGEEVAAFIERIYQAPKAAVERAKRAVRYE